MDISTFMIEVKKIEAFVATKPLLTGVIGLVFAVLCFGAKRLIDLYLVKPKTLRQQKTQLQFESYQKILGLLEGFFNDNAKVQHQFFHGDPAEKSRIVRQAQKEGKDPGEALCDYIAPLDHPEDLMIEIGKHKKRLNDKKLNSLVQRWGGAFGRSITIQRDFKDKMSQRMSEEKWIELFKNVRSSGDLEVEKRKYVMEYLRDRLR